MIMNFSALSGTPQGMNALAGLSSGELTNYAHNLDLESFEKYEISSNNVNLEALWNFSYNIVYQANAIIEGLHKSGKVSPGTALQLEGEARFIRAFNYFYLVNLFGGVPLITETDYRKTRLLSRASVDSVYGLIESDLLLAQTLLKVDYITVNRLRPNRATATALLARMYLYRRKYSDAQMQASIVLEDNMYALDSNLNKTFLPGSTETIWQLMPVDPTSNTMEGRYFVTGIPQFNILTNVLVHHFEVGDKRRINWINSYKYLSDSFYFPYKYKRASKLPAEEYSEYSIVFRLPEMYLIRAEARANLSDISGSRADLDSIRVRAGLPLTPMVDQSNLLLAIEKERWSEFFTEYGHRWLDLKRTDRAVMVLGNGISQNDLLYPVPLAEFQKAPNLGDQNSGY
jgi:hypothetical protein